ncbi:MAG: response regulator transcription factor [Acidimicrobiales bacterium]|nr:response regulator transcription factor [Acidimicrobiales bacterium]
MATGRSSWAVAGTPPTLGRRARPTGAEAALGRSPARSQETPRNRCHHGDVPGERLLLVDDEDNLRSMLEAALRHSGFEVHPAANGRDALDAVGEVKPDLIVLDVMLPDLDGFDVCQRLRRDNDRTPVLFLTARDATEDKVRGLTMGGDDYLIKPFSLDELVARINAVLRRTGNAKEGAVLTCRDLELDDEAHLVTKAGTEVALSPTEYNLLRYLLINQGRVLSKAQILDHVWQYDFGGDGGVVETYIGYLRKKVDSAEPRLIQTVRGVGYTLREPRA